MVAVPDVVALAKLLVTSAARKTTATKEHSGLHPSSSPSSYGSNAYGKEEEEEEEEEIEEDLVHSKTVSSRKFA